MLFWSDRRYIVQSAAGTSAPLTSRLRNCNNLRFSLIPNISRLVRMTMISRPTDKVISPAQPTSQPTSNLSKGVGLCMSLLLTKHSICCSWGLLCLVRSAGWRQSAGMAVGLSHLTGGRSRREGRLPSCVPAWWRPCRRPRHPAAATLPPHRPPPAHHPACRHTSPTTTDCVGWEAGRTAAGSHCQPVIASSPGLKSK